MLRRTTILLVLLGSHATLAAKNSDRFPDFDRNASEFSSVHILVDALPVVDVEGKVDGVYEDLPEPLAGIIADVVKESMSKKGFEPRSVQTQSGMFLSADTNLLYATKSSVTDTRVAPTVYESADIPWMNEASKMFFSEVASKAEKISSKRTLEQTLVVVPDVLKPYDGDLLVFVRSSSRHVATSKSLAIAMTTGLITGGLASAAGGGLFLSVFPTSGALTEIYVVDLKAGNILWHDRTLYKNKKGEVTNIPAAVAEMLYQIPAKDGQSAKLTKDDKKAIILGSKAAYSNVIATQRFYKAQQFSDQQYAEEVARYSAAEQRQASYLANIEILRAKWQSGLMSPYAYKMSVLREKLRNGWWFVD